MVTAMPTEAIGHVTRERYEQIIAGDREPGGQMQRIQFTIGDAAGSPPTAGPPASVVTASPTRSTTVSPESRTTRSASR